MRNSLFLAAVAVGALGMFSVAMGGTVTIPNAFVAGTPAKAADVNANFSAVATAVNGSAQDIASLQSSVQTLQSAPTGGVMVSVNGTAVGSLLQQQFACSDGYGLGVCISGNFFWVIATLNSKGFSAFLYPGNASFGLAEGNLVVPHQVYFDQTNCAGNEYAGFGVDGLAAYQLRQGVVLGAIDPTDANQSYYVKGSPVSPTIMSYQTVQTTGSYSGSLTAPVCSNGSAPSGIALFAMTPNNPAVTGVPKTLSGPITVAAH